MFKSYQQILDELVADWKAKTGVADILTDALTYAFFAVMARALRVVWFMLEQIINLFFVSTSQGSFLERRCNERGVLRKIGTPAKGTVNLLRTTPAAVGTTLTKGATFSSMDGKIEFTVDQDVTLPPGWTNVPVAVTSKAIGVTGNLVAATPLQIVGAAVVGVQNIEVAAGGLSGGVDTETDDQLRDRYLFAKQNPLNGGTPADYIVWSMEVKGVTGAIPLPLNRGPGTIDVVITDGGIPSDALVQAVNDHIQTKRPVGAGVQVLRPTAHAVDVTATVTTVQGYTSEVVDPQVQQAVRNYLASVPIGGAVRVTGIIKAALVVDGVLDFTLTAPAANIQLAPTEMATVGVLNIT